MCGGSLAGLNFEGHVSPLLLCVELCTGRTGQKHSGSTDNSKIACGYFAGKCGWAPRLNWCSVGSCEQGAVPAAGVTWAGAGAVWAALQLSLTAGQQPMWQESKLPRVPGAWKLSEIPPEREWLVKSWWPYRSVAASRPIMLGKRGCRSGWALVSQLAAPFQNSGFFDISDEWGPLLQALQQCCCLLKFLCFCSVQLVPTLLQLSITEANQSYFVLKSS